MGSGGELAQVLQDLARRVDGWAAGDAAARMRPRAAHVKAGDRRAVARPAEERPREEQLVERRLAVQRMTAREAVRLLQVERGQHLPRDDERREAGRVLVQHPGDEIAELRRARAPRALAQR